jgi:hypothetical protein
VTLFRKVRDINDTRSVGNVCSNLSLEDRHCHCEVRSDRVTCSGRTNGEIEVVPRQHSTQCISHLSLSCCIMTLLPLHKVVLDVVNSMVLWPATLYNPESTEWRVPGGNPVYSMGDAPELYRLYDETSNKTKGGLMVNQYGVEACEWKVQRSSLFSRARLCRQGPWYSPHPTFQRFRSCQLSPRTAITEFLHRKNSVSY